MILLSILPQSDDDNEDYGSIVDNAADWIQGWYRWLRIFGDRYSKTKKIFFLDNRLSKKGWSQTTDQNDYMWLSSQAIDHGSRQNVSKEYDEWSWFNNLPIT